MGGVNRKTIGQMSMVDFEQVGREQARYEEMRQNGALRNSTDPVVEPTADEVREQAAVYRDIADRYPQYAEWYTDYANRLEDQAREMEQE